LDHFVARLKQVKDWLQQDRVFLSSAIGRRLHRGDNVLDRDAAERVQYRRGHHRDAGGMLPSQAISLPGTPANLLHIFIR
jgi:hypothetical protein